MIKARIFTVSNEAGRQLVQVINLNNNKVFNGFVAEDNDVVWDMIEAWEEIWDCKHIQEIGSVLESVKVDKWAYSKGFIIESKFERVFE